MIVDLLHSGVPRLFDLVIDLPEPGFFSKLFGYRFDGVLRGRNDREHAELWWRHGPEWDDARRCPIDARGWLSPGQLWIDRGTGIAACAPELAADTSQPLWQDPEIGAIHLAVQTLHKDDGSGEIRLRVAWNPRGCEWVLALVSSRDQLDPTHYSGRKALIIDLGDLLLAAPGIRRMKSWSHVVSLGKLGAFAHLFGLAMPDFDRTNEDLLGIDFGTHETMAAILSKGSAKVRILAHPEPWYQQCIEARTDGRVGVHLADQRRLLPPAIRQTRRCNDGTIRLGMPSQCLRIPATARGHDLFEEVALGEECDHLIDRDPALLDAFRPCPKLFLATANNADDGQTDQFSTSDRRVVIGFLNEMFNAIAARQTAVQDLRVIEQRAAPQRRAVRPILYSFPVSLTQAQMDDLVRSFDAGLTESQLAGSIPPGRKRLEAAVDEASAAALGVFFHAFANLPIRLALDGFGPFSTTPRSDYAREMHVLSVDLGGGTSDLVLLHIGKDRTRPGWRVDINEAFGVPRAGLAVTMRIAARLKQEILQAVRRHSQNESVVEQARRALNTNFAFHPPGGERPAHISPYQWQQGNHRRERCMGWYRLAEEIKYTLCDTDHPRETWTLTSAHLEQLGVPELATTCDPDTVRITRQDLARITNMIFAAVFRKIREWLNVQTVDQVVLAGRSFRLPGMREQLDGILCDYNARAAANPAAGRRRIRRHNIIDLEWLEQHYGHLDLQEVATRIARDKALVVCGLVQRQSLLDNPTAGERLRSEFISSARRNRYIGLAEREMAAEGRNFVISDKHMIAIADEQIVRPEEEIRIPIAPGSTGFYLKINFLGPGPLEGDDAVDPPLSLARIAIEDLEDDEEHELEELTLIFRQLTASRVILHGLECRRRNSDPQHSRAIERSGEIASISCDQVNVRMDANMIFDDFRLDGIIAPEIDIDDIGGAQPVYDEGL